MNLLLGGVGDAKLIADVRKQIDAARVKAQALLKFAEALKLLRGCPGFRPTAPA